MTEININLEVLEEKLGKLLKLKEDCVAVYICDEDVVGSGQSTELIRDIREEYKMIKDVLSTLISNSIVFFDNIKKSEMSADATSASNISK